MRGTHMSTYEELSARYKEKLLAAEPEKARKRKEQAKREAIERALREELSRLQSETEPLFEFVRIIKEWVGPNAYPFFVISLDNPNYVLLIDMSEGAATNMEIVHDSGSANAYMNYVEFARENAPKHNEPSSGNGRTIETIRGDAETLKVLRQVNFDSFMEVLMDYAISNGLSFWALFRTEYVRLNC